MFLTYAYNDINFVMVSNDIKFVLANNDIICVMECNGYFHVYERDNCGKILAYLLPV
jgi:hypothetical protein